MIKVVRGWLSLSRAIAWYLSTASSMGFLCVVEFDRLYGTVMRYGVSLTDIGHLIVASLLYGKVGHFSLML